MLVTGLNDCISRVSSIFYDLDLDLHMISFCMTVPKVLDGRFGVENVLLRLVEKVPSTKTFKLFFNNWFLILSLLHELKMHRILANVKLGAKRIGNCSSSLEKDLWKEEKEVQGITQLIKVLLPIQWNCILTNVHWLRILLQMNFKYTKVFYISKPYIYKILSVPCRCISH